jgi:hypothetical protein
MIISVRIAGLERFTRNLIDQTTSHAQNYVDSLSTELPPPTFPVALPPTVEPPPPDEHMRPTRRPEP